MALASGVDDTAMRDDLLGNLRQLLELDRGLGLDWIGRGGLTTSDLALLAPPVSAPVITAPTAPVIPPTDTLRACAADIANCRACGLGASRITTVPGDGDHQADIVFVGEAPGADEDASGVPFAGKEGDLLNKMIAAMGLRRDQVFITNVLKCRPPANRLPAADEVTACVGYLHRQLALIRPKVICTLGNVPLRALMGDDRLGVTGARGTRFDYRGTPLIPTFHPGFLLRNDSAKKPCWEDLKSVLAVLGRVPPSR